MWSFRCWSGAPSLAGKYGAIGITLSSLSFTTLAVDAGGVWITSKNPGQPLLLELGFALVLLPGWAWAAWLWRSERRAQQQVTTKPGSHLGEEWGVFWIALQKELRQLWRTRRLLAMGAVFLVFGMGSPLLAKFTPEMLGMIEGAEMFKDLIPIPTSRGCHDPVHQEPDPVRLHPGGAAGHGRRGRREGDAVWPR